MGASRKAAVRNILFPVDFSAACAAIAPLVKKAASVLSAAVSLLYVLEPAPSAFELMVRSQQEAEADLRQLARKKLQSFLRSEFPAGQSPRFLLVGDPAGQIVQAARDRNFDWIAMPTHAGVFRRMLIGSTTAKVLDSADCPVFTARHPESIPPRQLDHREWLCAVGLQEDSLRVLRYAGQVAAAVHANLSLIHVIPVAQPGAPVQLDLDESVQAAERRTARQRIAGLQKAAGTEARATIVIGPVKDSLTETARRLRADVLVMGRRPRPGSQGRLRDLTYAVIRDAPCPVLSV